MTIRGFAFLAASFAAAMAALPTAAAEPAKDCENCPEMVVVPAGKFEMGDVSGTGFVNEIPVRAVTFAAPFAVSRHEVTFDQWDACVAEGGCTQKPADNGFGRGNRPVINVSWDDAQEYVAWLSQKTGKTYRLPTEAEWEYAARAGTGTEYFWGAEPGSNQANCADCGSQWDDNGSAPVGSFQANAFGLFDMHGNVTEWVEDCFTVQNANMADYTGLPTDGSAAPEVVNCMRVVRGGSWHDNARNIRSSERNYAFGHVRNGMMGFRVVRAGE